MAIEQALMHLLSAEVTALPEALEQGQDPLALGRQTLAAIMQRAAQRIGLHRGDGTSGQDALSGHFSTIPTVAKRRQVPAGGGRHQQIRQRHHESIAQGDGQQRSLGNGGGQAQHQDRFKHPQAARGGRHD